MTAEVVHLPVREVTTPPVEHTLTVRSGACAGFYFNGKKVSLVTAATMIAVMADAIKVLSDTATSSEGDVKMDCLRPAPLLPRSKQGKGRRQ